MFFQASKDLKWSVPTSHHRILMLERRGRRRSPGSHLPQSLPLTTQVTERPAIVLDTLRAVLGMRTSCWNCWRSHVQNVEAGVESAQYFLNVVLRMSSALWGGQRHPQVKSFPDQIHMRNATSCFGGIPCVWAHIGCEILCSKDIFSTLFQPACLKCIWWQNPVSKEHVLENTELSFFPKLPRFWGLKHAIQMLLSNITATRLSH